MTNTLIIGTGSCLPERRVDNNTLAQEMASRGVETSDAWIQERTGIRSRHIAADGQKSSHLGIEAARKALIAANCAPTDIDLIIVATSTPDAIFPSTACHIQRELGIPIATAFDVQAVCAGFVYALSIADNMIKTGANKKALVIGAEVFSNILDWHDRSTCVLFGDGAGAVVLSSANCVENTVRQNSQGILATQLLADGRHSHILKVAGQVCGGKVIGDPFLRMDGQAVFKIAVTVMSECAQTLLARQNMGIDQVDWLIPHQANLRIMSAVSKRLGIPESRVIATVAEHANTSAASIPLALDTAMRDGRIKKGQKVIMLGVGGGFTWGGVLVEI